MSTTIAGTADDPGDHSFFGPEVLSLVFLLVVVVLSLLLVVVWTDNVETDDKGWLMKGFVGGIPAGVTGRLVLGEEAVKARPASSFSSTHSFDPDNLGSGNGPTVVAGEDGVGGSGIDRSWTCSDSTSPPALPVPAPAPSEPAPAVAAAAATPTPSGSSTDFPSSIERGLTL